MLTDDKLLPCPFCGGAAHMQSEHDPDGLAWHFIVCSKCGARSRGKWNGTGGDCPELRAEVREEWNARACIAAEKQQNSAHLAQSSGEAATAQLSALRAFAQDIMAEWPEFCELDIFGLQDLGKKHGLLALKDPAPTEPCGEGCTCASYYSAEEFADGIRCYEKTALLTGEVEAAVSHGDTRPEGVPLVLRDVVEELARGFDGCMVDAVGGEIDVGEAIRTWAAQQDGIAARGVLGTHEASDGGPEK